MTSLVLNLSKAGDTPKKLELNLSKAEAFKVRLSWEGNADLDIHAIHAINTGAGAKATGFEDVLSTYNVERVIDGGEQVGTLKLAADKTFSIHGGALVHSPDALDGGEEYIVIRPDRIAAPERGQVEVPLIAMIHQKNGKATFKDVQKARVIIEKTSGEVLLDASLSSEFADFVGAHMGSIVIEQGRASFVNIGSGFGGDFNGVLAHFS